MKYACEISIKVEKKMVDDLVVELLDNLLFNPYKMDIFYNEFMKPRHSMNYNKAYLLDNLSKQEMVGITSFSLYPKDYNPENVRPFFRLSIAHLDNWDQLRLLLEWVAYDKIYQSLLLENEPMKNILFNSSLIYCYYYDQDDVWEQTNQENGCDNWGKEILVKGFTFIAAPLMYFGEECDSAIPFNSIDALPVSQKIRIKGKELLKVALFDIHDQADKEKNREIQKMFWKSLDLKVLADDYKAKNKIDYIARLKRRSELFNKKR